MFPGVTQRRNGRRGWPKGPHCPTPGPELLLLVGCREQQAAGDSGRHIPTCPGEQCPLSTPPRPTELPALSSCNNGSPLLSTDCIRM